VFGSASVVNKFPRITQLHTPGDKYLVADDCIPHLLVNTADD
jgi:hypothetical protein